MTDIRGAAQAFKIGAAVAIVGAVLFGLIRFGGTPGSVAETTSDPRDRLGVETGDDPDEVVRVPAQL